MRFDMWKSKAQKGAFLVLIAVLIPVFLILAALAVDLGKVWAYQSKMQNAVDAAALAGAQNLTNGDQIVDRIDTANHPNADRIAEKYIVANLGNDFLNGDNAPSYQAQKVKINKPSDSGENEEEWAYYRVAISRNIPMTFTKLLGFESFVVKADAVAKIQMTEIAKGDRYFDNLITFSGDMTGTFNNNQNSRKVRSTYDGDIVTIGNYYQKYLNDMKYKFYTPKTLGWPLAIAEYEQGTIRKDAYCYIKQGNSSEYTSKYSQYDKQIIDAFNSVRNDNKKCKSLNENEQNINISDQNGIYDYYYIPASNTQNLNISIGRISGDPDKPVYIFVDGRKDQIQISINDNMTGRPIEFMYLGSTTVYHYPWGTYQSGKVKVYSNSHKFRGVIYSPYSDVFASFEGRNPDPESPDSKDPDFIGSMAAKNLDLDANNGKFKFEQFALPGSSGNTSQGGESESISGKAELVANRVNPKPSWN